MERDEFRRHLIAHQKEKAAEAKKTSILKQPRAVKPTRGDALSSVQELPTSFYEFILDKYGHKDGVDLIAAAATDSNPLAVLSAILKKSPTGCEPLASYSGHYRFLKDGVLMDANQTVITKHISNLIQKAMIFASNELINLHRKTLDELYNVYDIGRIQGTIANFPSDKVRKGIASVTEQPSHSFFKQGVYAKKMKDKAVPAR